MVQHHNPLPPDYPPAIATTELIDRKWLSQSAFEVEIGRPQHFQFTPGHTIRLISGNQKRYYSLLSAVDDPTLRLCVNFIATGGMASLLAAAEIGSSFKLTGPHGYFNLSPSPRPPVFIATDTGVAPFVSMARSGINGFTLLHGSGRVEELYYSDLLRQAAETYLPCLWGSVDDSGQSGPQFHGKMVDLLTHHLKPGCYDFYLCGWQKMIADVTCLIDDRYPGSHVYTEVFY
jgi:benzoate/toluate 1,2-dioxygenase reductase component